MPDIMERLGARGDSGPTECDTCPNTKCLARTRQPLENDHEFRDRQAVARRMCRIKQKIIVLSGKGGVGKSTLAVNVAVQLAAMGKTVGLMDVDLHGPSVPKLLKLADQPVHGDDESLRPVLSEQGLKVMSIGFLLETSDTPVMWRGPMKLQIIRQFLKDVAWGELDYLVVDCPPGTGDEPMAICQMIGGPKSAIIVTTPQEIALLDAQKSISFCRKLTVPILGVVENMRGFVCPHCGGTTDIFSRGGAERMADEHGVPFLGFIPLDPRIVESGDAGNPQSLLRLGGPAAEAVQGIARSVLERGKDGMAAVQDESRRRRRHLGREHEGHRQYLDGLFGMGKEREEPVSTATAPRQSPLKQGLQLPGAVPDRKRDTTIVGYCGLACGVCAYACEPDCRHGGGGEDCYQRACCLGKGIEGCWECNSFPCGRGAFACGNGESIAGICMGSVQCIKDRGIEEFIRRTTEKLGDPADYRPCRGMSLQDVQAKIFPA